MLFGRSVFHSVVERLEAEAREAGLDEDPRPLSARIAGLNASFAAATAERLIKANVVAAIREKLVATPAYLGGLEAALDQEFDKIRKSILKAVDAVIESEQERVASRCIGQAPDSGALQVPPAKTRNPLHR